jgi:hypothetical protein
VSDEPTDVLARLLAGGFVRITAEQLEALHELATDTNELPREDES